MVGKRGRDEEKPGVSSGSASESGGQPKRILELLDVGHFSNYSFFSTSFVGTYYKLHYGEPCRSAGV